MLTDSTAKHDESLSLLHSVTNVGLNQQRGPKKVLTFNSPPYETPAIRYATLDMYHEGKMVAVGANVEVVHWAFCDFQKYLYEELGGAG